MRPQGLRNSIRVFTFATKFFCGWGEFDICRQEPCLGFRLYASHNLNSWHVKHCSKCQPANQIINKCISKAVKDRNRDNLSSICYLAGINSELRKGPMSAARLVLDISNHSQVQSICFEEQWSWRLKHYGIMVTAFWHSKV